MVNINIPHYSVAVGIPVWPKIQYLRSPAKAVTLKNIRDELVQHGVGVPQDVDGRSMVTRWPFATQQLGLSQSLNLKILWCMIHGSSFLPYLIYYVYIYICL